MLMNISRGKSLYLGALLSFLVLASCVSMPPVHAVIELPDSVQILTSNYVDGPYLVYENEQAILLNTKEQNDQMVLEIDTVDLHELKELPVYKAGLQPRTFMVDLKSEIKLQPSIYEEPDSIFAVSDIEGNFNILSQLMVKHGVLDDQINWSFGSGHFVFIGDIFDRGNHVTEMLWFLYGLEAQAEQAGGYVHVLLGNHEALNLRGDLRYIETKYADLALLAKEQLDMEYIDLFGPQSELGRWLRSKNVVEKIGDKMFVHAGLSPALVETGYSLEKINALARINMDTPKAEFSADDKLIWGYSGPFWYRGYHDIDEEVWGPRATQADVERILEYFGANMVTVGHTIQDRPVLKYNDRVFAINVKPPADHKLNNSQEFAYGVLIKNDRIYSANSEGQLDLLK